MNSPPCVGRRPTLALLLSLPLFTGCVISVGGCSWMEPKVWIEEVESRQPGIDGVARVRCETRNGHVRVTTHDDSTVKVVVTKLAGGADDEDAADCLEAIDVYQRLEGDTLMLGWEWAEESYTWGAEVSFEVMQPADLGAAVTTRNGAITCTGVRGGLEIESRNGTVKVVDCTGPTRIATRNGAVSAAVDSDDVHVATRNGGVNLRLAAQGGVEGSVTTRNGGVAVAFEGSPSTTVHCSSRSGGIRLKKRMDNLVTGDYSLRGVLGDGHGKFEVQTRNGGILIH